MSRIDDEVFERRTRELLDQSTERLPAHVRSRLNQARQRALEEFEAREARPAWRRWLGSGSGGKRRPGAWAIGLMPAGALAAVALVAIVLWTGRPGGLGSPSSQTFEAANAAGFEDIDLLADAEALDLVAAVEDPDFVEWAALTAGEALESGGGTATGIDADASRGVRAGA